MTELTCPECGIKFIPVNPKNTKYCSPTCGTRHYGRKICEKCGSRCYGRFCKDCKIKNARHIKIKTPEYIRKRDKAE